MGSPGIKKSLYCASDTLMHSLYNNAFLFILYPSEHVTEETEREMKPGMTFTIGILA